MKDIEWVAQLDDCTVAEMDIEMVAMKAAAMVAVTVQGMAFSWGALTVDVSVERKAVLTAEQKACVWGGRWAVTKVLCAAILWVELSGGGMAGMSAVEMAAVTAVQSVLSRAES